MPEHIIEVHDLTKYYGSVPGVVNATFQVVRGEVFGFLGPNGAGKTTCIRLLLDLLRPDSGAAYLFGHQVNPGAFRLRERIGNLPSDVAWWPSLTGREILDFFARFRTPRQGGTGRETSPLRDYLLDALKLESGVLDRKVRTYSRGTSRKLGLVAAMQHDPDLLILDEPTSGLDPLIREAFFQICRRFRAQGKTIFLSSHNLAETEEICHTVAIIRQGRIAARESIASLREKSPRRVIALFDDEPRKEWFAIPNVEVVSLEERKAVLSCLGAPVALVKALSALPLKDLTVSEPSLSELFLRFYKDGEGGGS